MTTRPRRGQRIDYAVLNNTGRIVNRLSITSPTISQAPVDYQYIMVDEESPTKQNITHHVQMTSIISDIVTGMDELTDIMVEHQLETSSQADNAETVKNLKDLRRAVRLQMNELQQIDPSSRPQISNRPTWKLCHKGLRRMCQHRWCWWNLNSIFTWYLLGEPTSS